MLHIPAVFAQTYTPVKDCVTSSSGTVRNGCSQQIIIRISDGRYSFSRGCRPPSNTSWRVLSPNESWFLAASIQPGKACVEYSNTGHQWASGYLACSTVTVSDCGRSGFTAVFPERRPTSGTIVLAPAQTLTIDEGGSGSLSVSLSTAPSRNATITLSKSNAGITLVPTSLTFTPSNYASAQQVTVSARQDDDAQDESDTIVLTASGGINAPAARKSVSVLDDEEARFDLTRTSLNLNEGRQGSFGVRLTARPSANVTVTLSASDPSIAIDTDPNTAGNQTTLAFDRYGQTNAWNRYKNVSVSAVHDDDTNHESVSISLRGAGGDYAGKTASVAVDILDDDPPPGAIVLRPSGPWTIGEGRSGEFDVSLSRLPNGNVTVSLSKSNADVSLSKTSLAFTPANYASAQSVVIEVANDEDSTYDTDTIVLDASGGIDAPRVSKSLSIPDNDTPLGAIQVSPSALLTIDEGGSRVFYVSLGARPNADATISLSNSNPDITLDPTSLTFTPSNYVIGQKVDIFAAPDADATNDTDTIVLTASGGIDVPAATLAVGVRDDDQAYFVLSAPSLRLNEGGQRSFQLRLGTPPSANVVVMLSASDPSLVIDTEPDRPGNRTTLAFDRAGSTNPWDRYQRVSVSAAHDEDANDESFVVSLRGVGGDYAGKRADLPVFVVDDDSDAGGSDSGGGGGGGGPPTTQPPPSSAYQGGLVVSPAGPLDIPEGGRLSISLKLDREPSRSVTVSISKDGLDLGLSPTSLTFAPSRWDRFVELDLFASEDADSADDEGEIVFFVPGRILHTQALIVRDSGTGLLLDPSDRLDIPEGSLETFSLTLSKRPPQDVLVVLSSREGLVSLIPNALTFTSTTWGVPIPVQVFAAEDSDIADDEDEIVLEASGGLSDKESLSVSVIDDDEAPGGNPGWAVKSQALAIPSTTAQDTSFVRIRCKQDEPCTVFLDCSTQAGEVLHGYLPAIRAWATTTLVPGHIERLTGKDAPWEGRLGCVLRSQASIGSQVWTRSGNQVLVNNGAAIRSVAEGEFYRADIESIPSPDAFDESNIRIRCLSAQGDSAQGNCLETALVCYLDDGAKYEASLGNIARARTRHLQSQELASRLGTTWPGLGLACEIRSKAAFTVQMLTRTGGGGALVNNSATGESK